MKSFRRFHHKSQISHPKANSGTFVDTDQGSILNQVLNDKQYNVCTSDQSKIMEFLPLIRNMNGAITYICVHEKLSYLWQINPMFKDSKTNILERIINVSASLWPIQQTDK